MFTSDKIFFGSKVTLVANHGCLFLFLVAHCCHSNHSSRCLLELFYILILAAFLFVVRHLRGFSLFVGCLLSISVGHLLLLFYRPTSHCFYQLSCQCFISRLLTLFVSRLFAIFISRLLTLFVSRLFAIFISRLLTLFVSRLFAIFISRLVTLFVSRLLAIFCQLFSQFLSAVFSLFLLAVIFAVFISRLLTIFIGCHFCCFYQPFLFAVPLFRCPFFCCRLYFPSFLNSYCFIHCYSSFRSVVSPLFLWLLVSNHSYIL